ncbi:MAG: tetratricopeptide repeat protein [bacterium]
MRVYSPVRKKSIYRGKDKRPNFIIKIILLLIFISLIFLGISKTYTPKEDIFLKYKKILEKDPANIEAYISLAECYYHKALEEELKGNEKEVVILLENSLKYYQNAIKLDEKEEKISPQVHYQCGIAYFKLSRYAKGKDYYEQSQSALKKSLKGKFETPETHIYLGHIYFKKGLYNDAIEEYTQAKTLNPDDVSAWYNIGWVYKVKGMPNNALSAFRNAVNIPNLDKAISIKIRTVMGELYYQQDLMEHAKDEYKAILKLNRNSEIAHYKLGKIHKNQGDIASAEKELKTVLKINPANKEAKEELNNLKKR